MKMIFRCRSYVRVCDRAVIVERDTPLSGFCYSVFFPLFLFPLRKPDLFNTTLPSALCFTVELRAIGHQRQPGGLYTPIVHSALVLSEILLRHSTVHH